MSYSYGEIIVRAVKSHRTVCRASRYVNKMLDILKNVFENKTGCQQHSVAVSKLSATHFLKWGGQLWSPLFTNIVKREKGKENDQEEVAASLQGTVIKVKTLHFVEKKAMGCMSQLHKI